jgi:predicted transcriptional regulator
MVSTELKQKVVRQIDFLDEDQLEIIYQYMRSMVDQSKSEDEVLMLSDIQKELIQKGMDDIKAGRYISQEELDEQDSLWLNEP